MNGAELLDAVKVSGVNIENMAGRVELLQRQAQAVPHVQSARYQALIRDAESALDAARKNAAAERLAAAAMVDALLADDPTARAVLVGFYCDGTTISCLSVQLHLSVSRIKTIKREALMVVGNQDVRSYLPGWYPAV